MIYVLDFSTKGTEFHVDREGKDLKEFEEQITHLLTSFLVPSLTRYLGDTDRVRNRHLPKGPGWLVRGRFIRVNQGSRALRMGVGFGSGGTKMETEVYVYDLSSLSKKPFLQFVTTGGSNAEPGTIVSAPAAILLTSPVGAVAGLPGKARHGITEDAERTARMITAEISQYMLRRGWIPPERALTPKPYKESDHEDAAAGKKPSGAAPSK